MKKLDIYTDGACSNNPGPGGYGAVILFNEHRKEISGGYELTTNNRMEMIAVIKALESLNEKCEVELYSDSKYVIESIEKGWVFNWEKKNWTRSKKEPVMNVDLWKEIIILIKIHSVKFIWVKGHNNNIENERCDFLAREFIKNGKLIKDEKYIL